MGIRIAEAANHLLGQEVVPHLWNTATLAGDLRHRSAQPPRPRADVEADAIAAKYAPGPLPRGGIVTDADRPVADLALEMIAAALSAGTLVICDENVRVCARCGHMTGTGAHACRACGNATTRAHRTEHLVAERDPARPVLEREDIHVYRRRPPLQLRNAAGNAPTRLILSRTREHGISLAPVGLPGLVLDPRAGLHVAVLAAARQLRAEVAVMTTTANAAINIAAHGQPFRTHQGLRLRYALHGHVPYEHTHLLAQLYESHRADAATQAAFEMWFLPLYALKEKNGVHSGQLPALFTHFIRTRRARPARPDPAVLADIRQAVQAGDPGWVMRQTALVHAMASTWAPRPRSSTTSPGPSLT
ncbi:hypothetical protein [Streptosporangium lutulentum]|uniref:Ribosomal protein L40E n=1 Tax=Streptosporangium lutulentum TaxID=1461250 RepID=A0ABT9QV28_9ACTN|nr:hypothetical protein [Streptosporangium lutulentum]MDP9850251.1 ribosomal protein L40E [Streptosporangium lutulentum]